MFARRNVFPPVALYAVAFTFFIAGVIFAMNHSLPSFTVISLLCFKLFGVFLAVATGMATEHQAKERCFGARVSAKDLAPGVYVLARSFYGDIVIGEAMPRGNAKSRAFDHLTLNTPISNLAGELKLGAGKVIIIKREDGAIDLA